MSASRISVVHLFPGQYLAGVHAYPFPPEPPQHLIQEPRTSGASPVLSSAVGARATSLKSLIEQSALPLRSVETDFAVDSSGFSTSVYNRWFDHKWGKERKEAKWVKAHLMCGVKNQHRDCR